jgi:hypothetical protein
MHLGNLWGMNGQLLARAIFANETASGWQQVLFSAPVPVSPATTYIASYHTDVGYYSLNHDYFATGGHELGPLRALANGEDGLNGVFRYGASGFPSDSWRSTNYWVTPIFSTQWSDTVPPAISSVQVTEITPTGATVRWQTDEPSDSRVEFGPTTEYGGDGADGSRVLTHALRLTNLTPNTGYHVRVRSRDGVGNQATSGDFTSTTAIPPAPPPPPPVDVCSPRPAVAVSTVRSGPGRLQVAVTAGTSSTTPANRLVALRFRAGSNALVDVGGQTGRTGEFTVALTGGPQQTTFYVRRAVAGQATTAPFVVVDDCGEFRSFVGGGSSGFSGGSATYFKEVERLRQVRQRPLGDAVRQRWLQRRREHDDPAPEPSRIGHGHRGWAAERNCARLNRLRRSAIHYAGNVDLHLAFLDLGCGLLGFKLLQQMLP